MFKIIPIDITEKFYVLHQAGGVSFEQHMISPPQPTGDLVRTSCTAA
ncbi:MAG: hypothetical protein ACI85U_004054 [Candidatus Promineifilaceae bacterium]